MKKTFFLFILFLLVAGSLYFFRFSNKTTSQNTLPLEEKTVNDQRVENPVRISIPSINVGADIEYVGLDEKRNMDVPKEAANVAWYRLGPKPGELGSAVLAGHLDDPSGNPAVFWDIKNLGINDEIEIISENGETNTFRVIRVENYPWNDFPLQEVFADSTGKRLNLITCGGKWDSNAKNYSERTVVYSELKE